MSIRQKHGTIRTNPKAQTKMQTSRAQRRKQFDRNISWPMLYQARGYGAIRPNLDVDAYDRLWKYARKCESSTCDYTTGGAWLKPDGKWYCAYCHTKVTGLDLLEQVGSIKEPEILVKHYWLYLFIYKIKRWFKCVTPKG